MSGFISDGFGDDPRVGEWLGRIEPFIGIVQSQQPSQEHRDDVMQEARIAVWKVLRDKAPTDERAYLIGTVKRRIREAGQRENWTGKPSQQGRKEPRGDSLDALLDLGVEAVAADLLDHVLDSYHNGEVYRAVSELPQSHRHYVYMRFWLGMTDAETAARIGVSKATVSRWWTGSIRPTLNGRLAHLR